MRVVADREMRTMVLADPVDLASVFAEMFVREVPRSAASCWVRTLPQGTEYRMMFGEGAIIERMEIRFDAAGWPVRTETVWRMAIQDEPGAPSSIPRMEVDYGRPQPIARGAYSAATDPARLVAFSADGEARGLGEWARYEVDDLRIQQP